jgi:hypothetical protein
MSKVIRTEVRRKGFFGHLFKWGFIIFNVLMAIWLFSYWGSVGHFITDASSDAARAGGAIGMTIGSSVIVFFWVGGAVILGLLALLTRGKVIVIEERIEG